MAFLDELVVDSKSRGDVHGSSFHFTLHQLTDDLRNA